MIRYVESLNKALHNLFKKNEEVYLIGEDILDPYGGAFKVSSGLSSLYPKRVISTPISEAAITGLGTGLAMKGMKPIVEIMFGDFITLCADQIINGMSKFEWMYGSYVSIPLVIRTPMGGRRGYGATHSQSLETLFLGIPGISIVSPSIYHNPGELLIKSVLEQTSPILFVENKTDYPKLLKDESNRDDFLSYQIINNDNSNFPTVSLIPDRHIRPDITLITYGGMAEFSVKAAVNVFMEEEINTEVLIPSQIKPLPIEDLQPAIERSSNVVIVEESIKTSGWGAELSSVLYNNNFNKLSAPIIRIGAKEHPIPSSIELERNCLPQTEDIESALYSLFN